MAASTPFEDACRLHGWERPADFLRAFHAAADVLGESVTLTDRQFRRWRQPLPPTPRARAWRVLHAMFGTCPTELGFHDPPLGVTVGSAESPSQRGDPGVNRRAFVADTFGAAAGMRLPPQGRPVPGPGPSGVIGTSHLLELRAGLRGLFQLDNAFGGGDVRSLAVRHLRRVRRIINTSDFPDTIGRQLHLLAGEIAEHCGWLYYDADDQNNARRYWGEALTTATMLRDVNLEIIIFSSMSLQACHEERFRDGLDLARAAQERATRLGSPTVQSLIAAREARALALMGDSKAAGRRMADAIRLIDRDGRGRPAPEWTSFHGPAELDYFQGLLYSDLGHHHAGAHFLRAALAHHDSIYGRNRALYRLTAADILLKAGEAEEAAACAMEGVQHLDEVESGRVTRKLDSVTTSLRTIGTTGAQDAADSLTERLRTGDVA